MAETVEEIEDLFRTEPSAFVAARDDLAKRLKAAGDKDAATEVKALRRPTVAAWAVNQVAYDEPALVDAVVSAGAALARAQAEVLAGGNRGALRAATAARRDAVATATRAAVKRAGDAHRDAIAATFDAAASDENAASAVRSGRLSKELDAPSGFALLGDVPDAPPPAKDDGDGSDDGTVAEARRLAEEAEAVAAAAREAAEDAERRRRRLADELEQASKDAKAATRAADEAETEARQARRRADRLS